jgi:arsenate reductase (thioredoxin)
MANVLFVCIGNSGRSVLAEQLLRVEAAGRHDARSAGSEPAAGPEPNVVAVLAELGIDASGHVPQKLTDELVDWADVVVAACDGACPVVPGKPYHSWHLQDPWGMPVEDVRELRDDVRAKVRELLGSLG